MTTNYRGEKWCGPLALVACLAFLSQTAWAAALRCEFHDEGGKPLKNVEVQLTPVGKEDRQFMKSGKSGEAIFHDLQPGSYEVRAQFGDRMPAKRIVEVSNDKDAVLNQTLLPRKQFDQTEKDADGAIRSGDFPKAVSLLEKLIAEYPGDALIHQDLGLAYAGEQEEEKAMAEAAKAAALDPGFAGSPDVVRAFLLRERGQRALKSQNYAVATDSFEKWTQIEPKNAQAHYGLALAYGHQGKYPQALAAISKALELEPGNLSFQKVKTILETNAGTK